MNKKTKGLVTAAVGASLLFGSAGTFALWYGTAALTDSHVGTGRLAIENVKLGKWTLTAAHYAAAAPISYTNPTVPTLSPGDVAYAPISDTFLYLTGDSIRAQLTVSGLRAALSNGDKFAPLDITLSFPRFSASQGVVVTETRTLKYDDATVDSANFSVVLSQDEVTAINQAIAANLVTVQVSFPAYDRNAKYPDGASTAAEAAVINPRWNYWGPRGQQVTFNLNDSVRLDFVQTNLPSGIVYNYPAPTQP